MTEFLVLTGIFWIPVVVVILKDVLNNLYFWQIKEYRFDRLWTELRWDQDKNRPILLTTIKFLLFSGVSLMFISPETTIISIFLAFVVWFNQSFLFLQNIFTKDLTRPKIKSPRNILILLMCLWLVILIIAFITLPFAFIDRSSSSNYTEFAYSLTPKLDNYNTFIYPDVYLYLALATLFGLMMDLASFFIVSLFVGVTWPLSRLSRQTTIRKARLKLKQHKDLLIIAITGSQGKTTAKEVLYELLKDKYNVAKTPENNNTDVGIAQAVLNYVKSDTEIFIAEMGAIRKGEIKAACKIAKPDIALITDIDVQHIGIFGSKKNLIDAKSEIVQNLKENGIAVLNADNDSSLASEYHNVRNIFVTQKQSTYKKLLKENTAMDHIYLVNDLNGNNLNFEISDTDSKENFKLDVNDKHLIDIIAQCISTAKELNVSFKTQKKILSELKIKLPRLSLIKGDNDITILDDTYSSNPKGFIAGVNKMQLQKGKRNIVITKGILELGKHKQDIYHKMSANIKDKVDVLITTDNVLAKTFEVDNTKIKIIKSSHKKDEMLYKIREELQPGDVILLEGRQYPGILEALRSEK